MKNIFILLTIILLSSCGSLAAQPGLVPPTVDQDPSLPRLDLNETSLHVKAVGNDQGPVIILLHGGPGNDFPYMEPLAQQVEGFSLKDHFHLIFWDQRSTGLSRRHGPEEITLDQYLKDLEALVEYFSPDRAVILLGHSWGGQYAAMYMNQHPEKIAAAIFVEPGEFSTALGEQMPPSADRSITAETINDMLWLRQFFTLQDHDAADFAYVSILASPSWNAGRLEDPSPAHRVGAAVIQYLYFDELVNASFDFTENLNQVAPEVLFVVGDRSIEMGVEFQSLQMELFQSARIRVVENAGHNDTVYSQADQTILFIRQYFRDLNLLGD